MAHFDLVIIGTGSGNTVITDEMADWSIAVVEDGPFGGTCLNVGCIPTKMFVYTGEVAAAVRTAATYGIDAHVDAVRWTDVRTRIFDHIDPKSAKGHEHREHASNTTMYDGHAEFVDATTIRLDDGREISGDRFVLATGARPVIPDMVIESGVPYDTSDTIMRIDAVPPRLVILGGGYIAAEFAHIFSELGSRVTIVNRGPRLLTHLDTELSRRFTQEAASKWDVRLDAQVASITHTDELKIALADGTTVTGDRLLVATGRRPNGDRLALDKAGVEVDLSGRIVVDEYQRTTADGIWALGDASSPDMLKHVANQDARIVAHNLVHPEDLKRSNHEFIPRAVFTAPQIASVGLTEEQAEQQGLDYAVSVRPYSWTAYGWAMEDTTSVCKVIAERGSGRLLGGHVMGPHASMLIQPIVQAMVFGQSAHDLAKKPYWIHPALTEVVENALLGLDLTPKPS